VKFCSGFVFCDLRRAENNFLRNAAVFKFLLFGLSKIHLPWTQENLWVNSGGTKTSFQHKANAFLQIMLGASQRNSSQNFYTVSGAFQHYRL
ncbi:hypothetical protein C1X16_30345, partial [Pseudomonas sp. FW305-3-2-15-C-R2A1]